MMYPFESSRNRYASLGVVESLPEFLIDSFWIIIDNYLSGFVPMTNLLEIYLLDNHGKLTAYIYQKGHVSELAVAIDLPFNYSENYPHQIYALDDGDRETILLPSEMMFS